MGKYKRFTKDDGLGGYEPVSCSECPLDGKDVCRCEEAYLYKLIEIEDKLESGKLIEVDNSVLGEAVMGIHKFNENEYALSLGDDVVIGFKENGVVTYNTKHHYHDFFENGMYFKDPEDANKKFKTLSKGNKEE